MILLTVLSLAALVSLLRGNDARRAATGEREAVGAELGRSAGLDAAMARYADGDVDLGLRFASGEALRASMQRALGHWGIWGPSGAGKSYFLILLFLALLRAGLRAFWVLDPKAETVELAQRAVIAYAAELPEDEREALLDRVVVIEPFSDKALPPMQVLLPEGDPELQAWEVATLIVRSIDAEVGVRQEALLHRTIECLIRAKQPITLLPLVLEQPDLLLRLGSGELFRLTAERLRKEARERIAGLVGRAERLLRLRSTRLMLGGATTSLDFARLLDDKIVLVNLAPPQGSADIGRFVAGLLWQKLTRAILARRNGASPAVVVLEEWPEFLHGGGPDLGDQCERILRLARSKGVFLTLLAQDLNASVGKACATLPQVVKTNLHWHAIFRSTEDWSFALPVTGRRLRAPGPPWEERKRGYLSRGEELQLLAHELANLPDRACWLLERRSGQPAVQVRTADLTLPQADHEVRALAERAVRNGVVVRVEQLARQEAAVRERLLAGFRSDTHEGGNGAAVPRRPANPPLDLG